MSRRTAAPWRQALGTAGVALAVSCGEPFAPLDDGPLAVPPDARPWVTGNALSNLDEQGHFVLPEPAPCARCVSLDQAVLLTRAYAATFLREGLQAPPVGMSVTEALEQIHGAPIDWSAIRPDERQTFHALTPYVLEGDLPGPLDSHLADMFLVPLKVRGRTVATLAVSRHTLHVSIDSVGRLIFPVVHGGEFRVGGIPHTFGSRTVPVWPEEAVQFVGENTNARVIEVPRLVRPEARLAARFARWEFLLDRDIVVRIVHSGEVAQTSLIYVGIGAGAQVTLFLAQPPHPDQESFLYRLETGDSLFVVPLAADIPTRFVEVAPVQ